MNDTTFQGDGKVAYVPVVVNVKLSKPITNADRIRSLSDEELAEWIAYEIWKAFAQGAGNPFFNQEEAVKLENQEWLDWLRKEVE